MNITVVCPECNRPFDLNESARRIGATLEDFAYDDGWLVPFHHEPGTPMPCDGTNQKVLKESDD